MRPPRRLIEERKPAVHHKGCLDPPSASHTLVSACLHVPLYVCVCGCSLDYDVVRKDLAALMDSRPDHGPPNTSLPPSLPGWLPGCLAACLCLC